MRNRIKFIILEIVVDKEDEELQTAIIEQISVQCDVQIRTVKRWINNELQPNVTALATILGILQVYNPSLKFEHLIKESTYQKKVKEKFNLSK